MHYATENGFQVWEITIEKVIISRLQKELRNTKTG